MTDQNTVEEIQKFIGEWVDSPQQTKKAFLQYKDFLAAQSGVTLDFKGRPGVSYSLRAVHENQKDRNLFVMVDVIDDDPAERWLSVCFYGDMITDPEEKGDFVPGGLLGEDGHCFDLDEWTDEDVEYIGARIAEACKKAAE